MPSLSKTGVLNEYPPPADRIDQLLDTLGNGQGTTDMATTADEYLYKPAVDTVAVLQRALIYIVTAARIDPGEYGDQAALTNGIKITVKDSSGTVLHDFTPVAITTNGHWALLAGSDLVPPAYTAGVDNLYIRWTFSKAGYPVILNGDKGEYFSCNVRDTLASLSNHFIQVQGFLARN